MPSTIGDKIIQYSGEADDDQIAVHQVIGTVTDRAVTIEKHPLETFFDRNFRIPEYQRRYEWDEENWTELWEEIDDIFEIDESRVDSEVNDIFFGSMFFAERDNDEVSEGDFEVIYDIIDGQQRIITLTILFKIMADMLHETMEEEPSLYRELSGEPTAIEQLIYQDVGAGTERRPSLIPNQHQQGLFNAMMGDEDDLLRYLFHQDRVHGNTKKNAIRIREFLDRFDTDAGHYLAHIDDDEYYDDDVDGHPNLLSSQSHEVRETDMETLSPDSSLGSELLSNKVRINDDTQRLIEAHRYFKRRLDHRLNELETPKQRCYAIINIKNYILYSYIVGYFEVESNQPKLLMKIFEILNDRGIELKKADVMRTRIVARFRSEHDREEYVEKWEQIVNRFGNKRIIDFLRTYFVVRGAATSRGELKNHLLEAFERNPGDGSRRKLESRLTDVDTARRFLDELSIYAKYYDDITDLENRGINLGPEGDEDVGKRANQIITRLRNADTSIWEPLVLGLYHDIVEESISEQHQLTELLQAVESMAIRKVAGMGTQTRDNAYADAMAEYHENGLHGDFIAALTDIETDDPNAVGAELVEGLYQTDWGTKWGKQVLRKIATEKLDAENPLVNRELNARDDIVHLEHIFPQTPVCADFENKYHWFRVFFTTDEGTDSDGMDIGELVSRFINEENETALAEIADEYISDLGNLTLLHQEENLSIQNDPFNKKILQYESTQDYCALETSMYICDHIISDYREEIRAHQKYVRLLGQLADNDGESSWEDVAAELSDDFESHKEVEEFLESELERVADELATLRERWTYREVTQNRAHLVRELCELVAFDEDEFENVDFYELSDSESNRKNDIIAANYRRLLE